jgi:microcystin-dependent protein
MKSSTKRLSRYIAMITAVASCGMPAVSYACSQDTFMSAVCVLAWGRNDLRGFLPANGQILSISQNSALFALLGTTYGGDGQTTFALPDLRGRAIIGAGTTRQGVSYAVGQQAGSPSVTLTSDNLPAHIHSTPATSLASVTAAVDLSKVTGGASTVDMTPVSYAANISALTLVASSATGNSIPPAPGGVLAAPPAPAPKIYATTGTPNVSMAAGTVGGSIAVTSSGAPTVKLAGSASVALTGNLPAGVTGPTGGNTAVSTITPYLAMYYFIATQGIFPSSN